MLLITVNTMYLSFIIISAPFVPDCVLFCSNVNNKWMRPLFLACLSPNVVGSAINEREERYYDAWRVRFVLVVRFCSIINNVCVPVCDHHACPDHPSHLLANSLQPYLARLANLVTSKQVYYLANGSVDTNLPHNNFLLKQKKDTAMLHCIWFGKKKKKRS